MEGLFRRVAIFANASVTDWRLFPFLVGAPGMGTETAGVVVSAVGISVGVIGEEMDGDVPALSLIHI